jgi:hypothetical protein
MADFKKCRPGKGDNVITPKARMSFPHLFTAHSAAEGAKPKFGVSLLIPADSDIQLLKDAAARVVKENWGDKVPKGLKSPFLKAGDYESTAAFEGWTLIRATAISKPGIVDPQNKGVTDESEVYPGRWCVASLRAFTYDTGTNKGVSFGLQNVQVLDHDEPLNGRARAEDEFEPAGGESGGTAASMFD